jgi:hypothetical protein
MTGQQMDPEDLANLADMVASRVLDALGESAVPKLIDAQTVGRQFGISPDWVRGNADRLGAVRLGEGPRPRLRFDPAVVAERLNARSGGGRSNGSEMAPDRQVPRRSDSGAGNNPGLLPVRTLNSRPVTRKRVAGRRANAPGPATRDTSSPRAEPTPAKGAPPRAGDRGPGATSERSRHG